MIEREPFGGSLPVESHEGLAPVAITNEWEAAHLVADPLPRTIARVALPAVASSLLMTLFFSVDAFWIGTHVGSAGLAAASTAVFWIWLLISVAEMVSVGLTAVAARRYGEGRGRDAARSAGDALVLALLLGAVCGAIGLAALPHLFAVMETPAEVTALGTRYLGTYLLGAPLIFGFFAVDAAFRAAGDTRTSFLILFVSVAVTLVLDPALIVGWGPFPRLGVAGAAIATICTRAVAFLIGLTIVGRRGVLVFGRPRWATWRSIMRIGLPTAVTGTVFSLIYILVTRTATQFGTSALAALGIGHRVESWLFMIGVGFGAATAAIVGQNLGAGRTDRAERSGWLSVGFCSLFGVAACIVELAFPERFSAIFSHDPAVIAEGARYLRIAAVSQLGICAEIVLEAALGGAGHTLSPMLTSTAITASRIPLAAWAAARWGTTGLWWVISLTALGRAFAMMGIWRAGRWKRSSIA
ncbi:MAG TPA: MATE family efflux transporter [Gemmatimonadaceae bacterium]|nr:MATE family efflux transporter [Gemmatimonadaceae bacterium]